MNNENNLNNLNPDEFFSDDEIEEIDEKFYELRNTDLEDTKEDKDDKNTQDSKNTPKMYTKTYIQQVIRDLADGKLTADYIRKQAKWTIDQRKFTLKLISLNPEASVSDQIRAMHEFNQLSGETTDGYKKYVQQVSVIGKKERAKKLRKKRQEELSNNDNENNNH